MRLLSCLTTAIALAAGLTTQAQYFEAGLSVGTTNYAGDLSDGRYVPTEYNGALGMYARYNHSPRLAARASLLLGELTGADARSQNAAQMSRNLSFESPLSEVALMGEFNVTPYAPRNRQGAAIYLTAGVAGFRYSPRADFNGEQVELQPLQTEGVDYSLVGFAVPFGGGVKLNLTPRLNLNLEVVIRRTFTDYLDDVSGDYLDVEAQHAEDPLTAALSFRAPQYLNEAQPNPAGTPRGHVEGDDFYMSALLSVGFNLTSKHGLDFDQKYQIFKTPPPAPLVQAGFAPEG